MSKLFHVFVALILVLIIGLAGVYFFSQSTMETSDGTPPVQVEEEPVEEEEPETEIMYYVPVQKNVDLTKNGPWKNDLQIASSQDGTTFSVPTTVVEKAGVPSLTQTQDGTILLVFQWFEDGEWFDFPALMTSRDNGATWTDPEPMKLSGYPSEWTTPFDPALVTLPDGRIRMYFTVNPGLLSGLGDTYISSAISDDGLIYTYEPGVRFEDTDIDLTRDTTVALLDDVWHLFSPSHDVDGVMNHGISPDGLDFDTQEDIEEGNNIVWLGNVTDSDLGLRFYGTGRGTIVWSDSSDGYSWLDETETTLRGADPAAVRLEDGTYLVVLTHLQQKE